MNDDREGRRAGRDGDSGGVWARIYGRLLTLYPPAFRRRFRSAMTDDFRRLVADEAARGAARPGWRAFRRAGGDLLRSVPREWGRSLSGLEMPGGLGTDLVHVGRGLLRDPRFTGSTVGVLALGFLLFLGAAAVANAYLVRPLPFPGADRIVMAEPVPAVGWDEVDDLFDAPISWDLDRFTLLGPEGPEAVRGAWVTPGYFDIQAVRPALGRTPRPDETGAGASSVILISWGLWQRRFGGDPDVVGRTVRGFTADRPDDATVWTVVGVLPRDFWFINSFTDVVAPLRAENRLYMGRLRPGVSRAQAEEVLTARSAAGMTEVPEGYRVRLTPVAERYVAGLRPTLVLLVLASALVLLIAAGNAGVLVLLRAGRRQRELGVRQALGAGRARLARQLVVEGVFLAAGAALLGFAGAAGGLAVLADTLQARLGTAVPGGAGMLRVDGTVALLGMAAATAVGLALGLLPLVTGVGKELTRALAAGGRGRSDAPGQRRVQDALVGLEIALTLALLVSAGLAVRAALDLARVDVGFEPAGLVTGRLSLRASDYPEPADRARFAERVLEGAGALPGVESAGAVTRMPLRWNFGSILVQPEGSEMPTDPGSAGALGNAVTPGWFGTLGVPVVRGGLFGASSEGDGEPVAVVDQATATRFWPGEDPVGRRFRFVFPRPMDGGVEPGPWRTVVGVVGDVRHALTDPDPVVYVPLEADAPTTLDLAVRLRPGATGIAEALAGAVHAVDPDVPLSNVVSMAEVVREATAQERFVAGLLSAFGAISLALAAVGLYGVVAYAVTRHRRDVAIRMALGADGPSVVRRFLVRAGTLVGLGSLAGLAVGYALARMLASRLHGVRPWDPGLYGALTVVLVSLALAIAWVPARRAARTDPMRILREE